MQLKNDISQFFSQILTEIGNSVIDLQQKDEEITLLECKRVIFHHLFLMYLGFHNISSSHVKIFNYNENFFRMEELNPIIERLTNEIQKRFSSHLTNIEDFSSFINEIQQHFMSDTNSGIVYTPSMIVKYMVKKTIENYFSNINFNQIKKEKDIFNILSSLKILDPSMGTGIFLVETLNQLTSFIRNNIPKKIQINLTEIKAFILKNCMYGVELELLSLEIARFLLFINVDDVNSIKTNIIKANTLIDPVFSNEINEFSKVG